MASEIEICNQAMSRLGLYSKLTSIVNPVSKEERECAAAYSLARDFTLEAFDWTFARKRKLLGLVVETYSGWTYAYQVPSDCLIPRSIYDPANAANNNFAPVNAEMIKFETLSNDALDRTLILTNQEDAELIYTGKVTEPGRFSASFREAVVFKLASDIAMSLTRKADLQNAMYTLFMRTIAHASITDATRSNENLPSYSSILGAR